MLVEERAEQISLRRAQATCRTAEHEHQTEAPPKN
jgi:hypothetical protein